MRDHPELEADCERCAALCCVLLAFDKSEMFAIDKAAGEPCRHLGVRHMCAIHAELENEGFKGCVLYDCLGAGQRVVQEVFDGRSWRDDPSLLTPMMDAFRAMRKVHEMLQLMQFAAELSLTPEQQSEHALLMTQLEPESGWDAESLQRFESGTLLKTTDAFLKGLRAQVGALPLSPATKRC